MAKGIIVVEMPEKCAECPLKSQLYDNQYICTANHRRFSIFTQNKPDWCPIRQIPTRKSGEGLQKYDTDIHYEIGWNDCLDYLEGRNGE